MYVYEGEPRDYLVTFRLHRRRSPLPMRLDLCNHSPTGFCWGYQGSGPAQLALALIAHATKSDETAIAYYHSFKVAVVAKWPMDRPFRITQGDIQAFCSRP